ncbi:YidC family membrane integrase SpoIIIJ [Falsibacillus pallidus]|uniref:Membrane protein insertase YidC n=1 Tax=Falsibacillus pallidus TaxID=493781 RepID=A0A370GFW3_9BACI|nr:YidC family membrane integrase SpoIIIJ [Falsibacillus pallidus]RDI40873.1 protein translocase subunit yidC [Falsibacillus pallidus]
MKKRIFLLIAICALSLAVAGCSQMNDPIDSSSQGFWNEYIVYPLSWLILKIADLTGNFGVSIILVTLLIRLVIMPFMVKQTQNTKAMQSIQGELDELKQKYPSRDGKSQQMLQRETMELFQKSGVNPLAGCLPLIIQMPILIGFYHAISRTKDIAGHSFLWFDLGAPDPLYVLPLIAGVTTFIQQRMMTGGMASQNPQMAMMVWIMPVMIIIFAINFPAALSLYWVVGNIFMIIQTYIINGPGLSGGTLVSGHSGGAKR